MFLASNPGFPFWSWKLQYNDLTSRNVPTWKSQHNNICTYYMLKLTPVMCGVPYLLDVG